MGDMDEIIREFLVESTEGLDRMDRDLVELEKTPESRELLASIFRAIHTIKGTSGVLGFSKLESVAHAGENLLSLMRDGKLRATAEITSAVLAMGDTLRTLLGDIEASGKEGDRDCSEIVERVSKVAEMRDEGSAAAAAAADDPVVPRLVETAVPTNGQGNVQETRTSATTGNIRVDVALLDKVMNLVGELVLARNQILQFTAKQSDTTLLSAAQRLNLITTELQEGVMKTRMQPIGNVWNKFPRLVRDVAVACGKRVRIELEGSETELDKTIIEAIKDPLTHVVRNAIDHGIEDPEQRVNTGKPAEGRLLLRAFHEGGHVNIEISDDGRGVDLERVRQKAMVRGLASAEQLGRMSDREVLDLIFLPGFSTTDKVTNISGRGVGMDVVKTNVERIGGSVDVSSTAGQGTTLKIKIPLTLAIIPALVVTSSGERFAIPQISLLELVRLDGGEGGGRVEHIQGGPVYRLRGNLLPLVFLNRELGMDAGSGAEVVNIVVMQADGHQFGLVVDEINETEEIVVKPLGKHLKGTMAFAGATIMGDGKVALILDVMGIAQIANALSRKHVEARAQVAGLEGGAEHGKEQWLLFTAGADCRMAVPLAAVARLEEVVPDAIEHTGDRRVLQYRGEIMPLIDVADTLRLAPAVSRDTVQVIVQSHGEDSIGFVVNEIVDVVDEWIEVKSRAQRPGVKGTAVIQKRVTEVIDLDEIALISGVCRDASAGTRAGVQSWH